MLLVFQTISYEAPPFSDDEKVDDFDDFWPLTIFRQRLAWHSLWHFILLTDQVAASAPLLLLYFILLLADFSDDSEPPRFNSWRDILRDMIVTAGVAFVRS